MTEEKTNDDPLDNRETIDTSTVEPPVSTNVPQGTNEQGTGLALTGKALDIPANAELTLKYDENQKMSVVIGNVTAKIGNETKPIGDNMTPSDIYDLAKNNELASKGGKKKGGVTKRRRNRQKKSKRVYKKKLHK
jgi:hypothetical protein